jgi:RNA polymerase sigma-70 factor, ECF subfamily
MTDTKDAGRQQRTEARDHGEAAEIDAALYKELRRIAAARMRMERGNHTLQPTALVHEAYMRLADQPHSAWQDRARILGLAARAMRHILVDHARAHSAGKRGAGAVQITLDDGIAASSNALVDILVLDEALTKLAGFDSRQARILELHFFAGLTFEEIADELGLSLRTVKKDSSMARAWLRGQLAGTS